MQYRSQVSHTYIVAVFGASEVLKKLNENYLDSEVTVYVAEVDSGNGGV